MYIHVYTHIIYYRSSRVRREAADLVFGTLIVKNSSGEKYPIALHAVKIIRDQFFLVLPMVPSENA